MGKKIQFEKVFNLVNEDLMRVTVKESGIKLGWGKFMNVEEVQEYIKSTLQYIKRQKDDIRVAKASIELFKKEFGNK